MSEATKISARTVLTDPVHLLAFGFGLGLSPVAPGTVGSLLGVGIAWQEVLYHVDVPGIVEMFKIHAEVVILRVI